MDLSIATGWTLAGLGGLFSLLGCGLHATGALALLRVPRLAAATGPGPATTPRVAAIVPACNEVDALESSVRSLLAQDLPGLEVVLVDDRSTDGTSGLADRLAAADPRVRSVHVTELPAGWLGKVHALARGAEATDAEFLLFTDADVWFAPGAIRAALELVSDEGLDHLTLLPRLESTSPAHAAMMQAFFAGYVRRSLGSARVVTRRTAFGFGAFNLVRRSALDRTAGLAWLRMDVLDDLALGRLLLDSGARCGFAAAPDLLSVLWYPGIAAAVRGFEKNAFGGLAGYSAPRAIGMSAGCLLLALAPVLAIAQDVSLAARGLGLLALAALAAESLTARLRFDLPLVPGLLAPFTHAIMAWALLRATVACLSRGGIRWRGTIYSLAELRAGRRVSFP